MLEYKDIQVKSNMAFYLVKIPQVLPEGTWLKSWDFVYNEERVNIEESIRTIARLSMIIEGYAYVENTNEQFRLVNNLLGKLKNTKDIAGSFSKIDLITVRQETLDNYPVT